MEQTLRSLVDSALPTSGVKTVDQPGRLEVRTPVRIQFHAHDGAVSVWLGVDADTGLDIPALVQQLRQALERQGLRLQRVMCNGRPVYPPSPSFPGEHP